MFFAILLILCAVNTSSSIQGDSCSKEGVEGVCTNLKQCPDALEDIKNRKRPQHCVYGTPVPIVCCVSAKTTESPRRGSCILPPYPEHGTYTTGVPVDKPGEAYQTFIVNVTCDQGYVAYGPQFIFCRDGWWPEQMPTCVPNPCRKDGIDGVCTQLKNCPAALQDLSNKRAPKHCWFGSVDPIVCCVPLPTAGTTAGMGGNTTASPLHTTTTKTEVTPEKGPEKNGCPPLPPSLAPKPTGQKAWDKCLEYQEKLVFPCEVQSGVTNPTAYGRSNRCHHNADSLGANGPAVVNEFPHIAMLGFGDSANLRWRCSGSLISENYILTTARCANSEKEGAVSYVQLPAFRRSAFSNRGRHKVRRIIVHPEYEHEYQFDDIALLELEKPVQLDHFNVPACLFPAPWEERTTAVAVGWGLSTKNGTTTDDLQKVILTSLSGTECLLDIYRPTSLMGGIEYASAQICYGDKSIKNNPNSENLSAEVQKGEFGGPLMIKSKQIACMYTIEGLLSRQSQVVGDPGIYTNIPRYLNWIESIVWP